MNRICETDSQADPKVAAEMRCGRDARGVGAPARRAWERAAVVLAEHEEQASAWQRSR